MRIIGKSEERLEKWRKSTGKLNLVTIERVQSGGWRQVQQHPTCSLTWSDTLPSSPLVWYFVSTLVHPYGLALLGLQLNPLAPFPQLGHQGCCYNSFPQRSHCLRLVHTHVHFLSPMLVDSLLLSPPKSFSDPPLEYS